MNKKRIRLLVDIGMVILLPLLMAYSLIGEKFHEMIGTVMAVLFVDPSDTEQKVGCRNSEGEI